MPISDKNKRIAKNTVFLYIRLLLAMAVNLYTVRIVLAALGEEDYGIYHVVGGFVAMFNILSGALSITVSRFITYEMGLPDVTISRLQRIYSSSLVIQVVIGLVISLLIASAGVWFMENKMVIPAERMNVAHYVLLFSALTFFIQLISVPYNALIIAHEQMKAFAYISIVEVFLQLGVACLLTIASSDKLLVYALCMAAVALIVRSIYAVYCKRHFAECRFVCGFDKSLFSKMFRFTGWAFLGNGAIVLKDQGSSILLNLFGGPAVNAAQGIAMRVNTAAYSFVSNYMTAANPQIIKDYAAGDLKAMHSLIIRSGKFGFFILLILLLPLCSGIEYILGVWLVEVPAHTTNFIILILLYSCFDCFGSPLVNGVLAQGKIKSYEIALSCIYVSNILASYLCLKMGMAVETVFVLNIVFKMIVIVALLVHSRAKYAFPVGRFFKESFLPASVVFLISAFFVRILPGAAISNFGTLVVRSLAIAAFTGGMILLIGMTKHERKYMMNFLMEKIRRRI